MSSFRDFTHIKRWRCALWAPLPFVVLLIILAVYVLADLRRVNHGNRGDFLHFYYAAKALAAGGDPYTAWQGGYIYPPLLAFLYRPLVHFSEVVAIRIALFVNVGLLLLGAAAAALAYRRRILTHSRLPTLAAVMLLAILFNLDKVRLELQMWQTNVIVFLCFSLALLWMDDHPFASGSVLGFAFNIKYLTLPMLPYLALRRRWKVVFAYIAALIAFALLPAFESGWNQNLRNLAVAFSGLLRLVGLPTVATSAANIEPVHAFWSCSITTAAFRHRLGPWPPAIAIGVAVTAFILVICGLYKSFRIPLFHWPAPLIQIQRPWRALVALEWTGLIAFTLAFSPQTNTAHLFNALAITTPAAVFILSRQVPTPTKVFLAACMLMMLAGFSLPPGKFNVPHHARLVMQWKQFGGPCWCLLLAYLGLLWAGLRIIAAPTPPSSN